MEISSLCPFRVSALVWEAEPAQFSLSVAVKATFSLVHGGEVRVDDRQEPIGGDRHWDDHPGASLFSPADEVPLKRKTDVVLVGHAYAPVHTPAVSLVARLTLGDALVKSVRVTGDRLWEAADGGGLRLGPAKPFLRLPLRYERAPLSADNPVGIDEGAVPILGAPARPNLEPMEEGMVGFGPIASAWRSRRTRVVDEGLFWAYGVASPAPPIEGADPRVARSTIGPPPPGFDFGFFNAAPVEQQVDLVRPGMQLELENMSPGRAVLSTTLPAMRPQVFLVPPGKQRGEEVALRCDTLWIDCDRELLSLTFRGVTEAGSGDLAKIGTLWVVADDAGKRLRWDDAAQIIAGSRHPKTLQGPGPPAPTNAVDPLSIRYDAVLEKPKDVAPPPVIDDPTTDRTAPLDVRSLGVARPLASPARPIPAAPRATGVGIPLPPRPIGRARNAPPPPSASRLHPPIAPRVPGPPPPIEMRSVTPVPPAPSAAPPPASTGGLASRPSPARGFASRPSPARGFASRPSNASEVVDADGDAEFDATGATAVRRPPAAKPPSLAEPIDEETTTSRGHPRPRDRDDGDGDDVEEPTSAPWRQVPPPVPSSRIDPLVVGRYAAVSAHLTRDSSDEMRAAILEAHEIDEDELQRMASAWNRWMANEDENLVRELSNAFDLAYVAALESLDPPIGIAEYAGIVAALERGEVGRVLKELRLELTDLMRLQRVWTRRASENGELAARLDAAVEHARGDS